MAIGLNYVATYDGSRWSLPRLLDQTANPHLFALSCPASTFCVVANSDGYVWTMIGSTWSGPLRVDAYGIDSVSCASAALCMAVDTAGGVARWDGHAWHPATVVLDAELPGLRDESVSCATPTFCVATSPDSSAVWNGAAWSTRTTVVAYPNVLVGLSCPAQSWCAALDVLGTLWTTTTGRTWMQGPNDGFIAIRPGAAVIRPLECWSPASCLVAGSIDPDRVGQDVKTYDGLAWSAITVADPTDLGNISAVSCATTTFCAAVDDQGYVMVRHGATWSYPEALEPQVELGPKPISLQLDCPSAALCVAADNVGNSWTYDGSVWSPGAPVGGLRGGLVFLSCPTTTFCMGWGSAKAIYLWNGKRWKKPLGNPGDIGRITCASATDCLGFTDGGVRTWSGTGWSSVVKLGGGTFTAYVASCAAPGDCLAIDAKQGVQLRGTRWSAPFATPVTNGPMSCVSVATCRFVATDGGVVTVTNGVAGSTTYLDPLGGPNIIDCATASFCLVGALFGIVYTGT